MIWLKIGVDLNCGVLKHDIGYEEAVSSLTSRYCRGHENPSLQQESGTGSRSRHASRFLALCGNHNGTLLVPIFTKGTKCQWQVVITAHPGTKKRELCVYHMVCVHTKGLQITTDDNARIATLLKPQFALQLFVKDRATQSKRRR